ncbi:hypothetical protein QM588_25705, partial [Rhodococcus sp. IEGM 1354]|nr:hypothetical protein [Rhodococcus sp. IEGM 1354]
GGPPARGGGSLRAGGAGWGRGGGGGVQGCGGGGPQGDGPRSAGAAGTGAPRDDVPAERVYQIVPNEATLAA